ncbi:MAG: hypothetical protein RL095_592 [Verrucomicrobiota bacterium]|jgi:peroxiredoxin
MTPLLRIAIPALILAASCRDIEPPPLSHRLGPSGHPEDLRTLKIGDAAPDFDLPGIDGRNWRLKDFDQAEVLMVLFTSNHCPSSHGIEKRLQRFRQEMKGRSFALVAINPNHPDGLSIDELGYGRFTDSFADMKPYAASNGWDFPYLYDGDEQRSARAYGCLATPHVFVFDKNRRLRYSGRFDDSPYADESTVRSPDARRAVEALLAGRAVPVETTRPHGCSTKWREKKTKARAVEAAWTQLPVSMDSLDDKAATALRSNPTQKYRLIHLWATWCAPCVREFPELVSISRQYDMRRNFEVITISLDTPRDAGKVLAFLQKQGAGVSPRVLPGVLDEGRKSNHYLYAGAGQDALAAALDREWPGPVPHTLLVAPGGEILWRHNGPIEREAACEAIVKALKPYYSP